MDGKSVDLSRGWGEAQTCVVRSESAQVTHTVCYRSAGEADAALGVPAGAQGVSSILDCPSGWLCLWENEYGGGRRLLFSDEYGHDLAQWDFAYKTSSFFNMQDGPPICTSADDPGELWDFQYYSLRLDPCAGQNTMGAWNDRATRVFG
ncbi:peptidase inhibitor family I36 protein [Actinokineospora bangkokensis]|nr:peptidase inhibitor family I36 protein [Actinokineospora bangkokensis]